MKSHDYNPLSDTIYSLHDVAIPDPGAGNIAFWTCPLSARVQITAVQFRFSTVNANRHPQVGLVYGGVHGLTFAASDIAPNALTTTDLTAAPTITANFYNAADDLLLVPMSPNLIMEPTDEFFITSNGLGAGQSFTDIYLSFKQWIIA